jgi:hypothetical protein
MKPCSTCGVIKPLDQFSPSRKGLMGRVSRCKSCRAAYTAAYRSADPVRALEQRTSQYAKHREKRIAEAMAWNAAHPERHLETMRRYQARHPEQGAARSALWVKNNLPRKIARNLARAKRVRQATPPWVDLREIAAFYLACPPGHEVDHIWPIKGRTSCGLHVLWNLQYLPKRENRSKFIREPMECCL